LAEVLAASSDRFFKGSRLRLLEIQADGALDGAAPGPSGAPPLPGFGAEGCRVLSLGLARPNLQLCVLNLEHDSITDDMFMPHLAHGLAACATLRRLSLAHNELGPPSSSLLADLLRPTALCKLEQMNLASNRLGGQGLLNLSDGIGASAHLKHLSLADNGIDTECGSALQMLVEGLDANSSLESLDLDRNHVGSQNVAMLLPILAKKIQLKRFRVTERIDPLVMANLCSLLKTRNEKSKKKKGGKRAKKKK